MAENVADRVIAIIAEQAMLSPEEVSPEDTLEKLGVDSLGLVEVVFAIEERFDIHVPFNANAPGSKAFDISSVQSIIDAVDALVHEAG